MEGERLTSSGKRAYSLLAPLEPENFERLMTALAESDVSNAAAILSVKEETVLQLMFSLAIFPISDGDVVRMTAHEHKHDGGAVPAYDKNGETAFAFGVRNALMCLRDYPQFVRELVVPESDLPLPEFRFAALKAAVEGIPVRSVSAGFPGITAILEKEPVGLSALCPHTVLYQVLNPGNIGAIIRSAVAFGIRDIALIETGTDGWDPEIIAVSRCSSLAARIQCFDSIFSYMECFPEHKLYPLMLQSSVPLDEAISQGVPELYSVVLGNESRGLPPVFSKLGTSVIIPIETVGSLNVSAAAAVSFYAFTGKRNKKFLL